ncbi:hypothetical protein GIB67_043060 [Kingdonia uniflora]|uniref:RING-type domain-containing protein n=1 Tax=Kingdonia uniflora TaxID=39325 RepID=A0A7J7P809_9MAGN|nr:hypothetical protein GIB67_043060 [Kingdonia uniflora]
MTTSSSNRMVEDGSSPTQVSSGDVICDETVILKVMNGVQEKSMAAVDKISNIVENSAHKIFIGGISEALSSNMEKAVRSLKCHQCQRNDKGDVIHYQKCNTRQFCLRCIRWYPQFSPDDIAESCPVCRGICNCKPCLRANMEHQRNFCKTSIANYHRSCPSCSYDYCLGCCQDIRSGFLQRGDGWKVKENGFGAEHESRDIQDSDQEHFQKHWFNGEPMIVGDALDMASGLSWDLMILSCALREKKTSKVFKNQPHLEETTIDCLLWSEVDHHIHDQTFYLTSEHKKKLHDKFGCARLFNEAAQISPDDADVHIVLGVLYNLSKEYDKAIGSFQTA